MQEVVRDITSLDESGLAGIHEEVQGKLEAIGDDLGDEANVGVEQANGAVARQLVRWFVRLE
jgi:hypothetical protein